MLTTKKMIELYKIEQNSVSHLKKIRNIYIFLATFKIDK